MIYFDNNSTSFLRDDIRDKMLEIMSIPYNSSSVHILGRKAKSMLEEARVKIAHSLNLKNPNDYQIIFTSSATEGNNMLINNFTKYTRIISSIEHSSIIKSSENYEGHILVHVNKEGLIDLEELEKILIANDNKPKLVSIMLANNETGVVQDIKKISEIARRYSAIMHSDLVQAYGKIDLDFLDLGIDLATISAHKCSGPTGVGCLIAKKNIDLKPFINGGGQERSKRAGTENLAAIVGFGMVAEKIDENISKIKNLKYIRDYIESSLTGSIVVSKAVTRLDNTSCIIMPGVSKETQLIDFDLNDIALSAGSACSSGKVSSSHVLKAYKIKEELSSCAIRISLGIKNTKEEAEKFIAKWLEIYNRLSGGNNVCEIAYIS